MIKTTSILSVLSVSILAGCSGYGGKDHFECPNTNEGAACISARQIYAKTHVSDRVQPAFKDGKPIDKQEDAAVQVASNGLNAYRPPLPEVDTPLPIRTPPKVMRIRVFPWEDNSRDLNTGGYVYTEVEGRQWTIGEEQVSRIQANVITPLAMPTRTTPNSSVNSSPLAMSASSGLQTSAQSASRQFAAPDSQLPRPGFANQQGNPAGK